MISRARALPSNVIESVRRWVSPASVTTSTLRPTLSLPPPLLPMSGTTASTRFEDRKRGPK